MSKVELKNAITFYDGNPINYSEKTIEGPTRKSAIFSFNAFLANPEDPNASCSCYISSFRYGPQAATLGEPTEPKKFKTRDGAEVMRTNCSVFLEADASYPVQMYLEKGAAPEKMKLTGKEIADLYDIQRKNYIKEKTKEHAATRKAPRPKRAEPTKIEVEPGPF